MLTGVSKIPVKPTVKNVMTRLGIKTATDELQDSIEAAISRLDISGICMPVKAQTTPNMVLLEGQVFPGEKFAAYMGGCDGSRALLLAATAGQGLADAVAELMEQGDARGAVILDAAAAVAVDDALSVMTGNWARQNARLGLRPMGRRFSPGYGDLPLSCQKTIYDLISADRLGLSLTEGYMLQPDKSVFAICGVCG